MKMSSLKGAQSIKYISRIKENYVKRTFSELSTYKRTDIRLIWLTNYVILSRLNSRFHFSLCLNSIAHLRGNILWPGRKCWEDRYKLNECADERSGRRAYQGRAGDAVGAVSELFNPSSWIVTPRVAFCNHPN